MTFTLPGFSTVKREGIELSGSFVATVNGDLKVGALEETITVTGETPIVDVQSAKVQQTVSKDILAAIPSSRNAGGIQALIPGNEHEYGFRRHLRRHRRNCRHASTAAAATIRAPTTTASAPAGPAEAAAAATWSNVAGAQEIVISTSGGLGEAETSGVVLNLIPREGGNTFSGSFFVSGANGAMQGSNYTQALKDQGLKAPSELMKVYDFNPMGGGRILRDKLWFYLTYREWGADNTVPGHVRQQERRQPECLDASISTRLNRRSPTPRIATASRASHGRPRRATRSTCTGPSSATPRTRRAAARRR